MYSLCDEELLSLIHRGENMALNILIAKYKNFVRIKTGSYFLIGADREDIVQEGMIGLYKAIKNYDQDKLSSFRGFADLCITRQILTAIKMATRQKHIPLNSYVSLDKPIFDEESDRTLMDVLIAGEAIDPQDLLISRENYSDIGMKLSGRLSVLEKEVLKLYIEGFTYQEISSELNRHVKSVDNAIQRVKIKLEKVLITEE